MFPVVRLQPMPSVAQFNRPEFQRPAGALEGGVLSAFSKVFGFPRRARTVPAIAVFLTLLAAAVYWFNATIVNRTVVFEDAIWIDLEPNMSFMPLDLGAPHHPYDRDLVFEIDATGTATAIDMAMRLEANDRVG
jgi:hypothetical protein